MAIAPLPDIELLEAPWPRSTLRLVEPLVEAGRKEDGPEVGALAWDAGDGTCTEDDETLFVATGPDLSARRHVRTSARVRRRRLALGMLVVGLLVALAVPVSALGGRPASASPPAAAAGSQAGGEAYVVQPGDTLWSIASQVDGTGNPRALVEALSAQLGSSTVVPGERIVIP